MMDENLLPRGAELAACLTPQLAEVIAVEDPEQRGRIEIRLLAYQGVEQQNARLWARVAVPFAGDGRGAFLMPDVGDEVLVSFVNGDPRQAVVVGGLWNGASRPPEQAGRRIDRWTLTGKAGSRIAIVEPEGGDATVEFSTPGGVRGSLSDEGGGRIRLQMAGASITLDSEGITLQTGLKVKIEAGAQVEVSAAMVSVNAGMSRFSGVVQADTVITNSVISASYTPGAGNIW